MKLTLEFTGGMELLFQGTKKVSVTLPEKVTTVKTLLPWIRDSLLKSKPDMFMQGDTVRPGVLVLINDADWELEGQLSYELQEGDTIVFISTLHGG
ncbi:ubiquitin-related modifier 1 [Gonapodya prolifera JEL478]|uniref:Ubiquitin-related modifier 1 n=1 Tax=Gonapodya prolifera (strain JEL478) TaxID=1344416 RepID=A0A139AQX9_GONPJ|nr:ubiquitin-related modifier 1 [Gonapodya prolifera JEL478]|eukprot:KXS18905.1 ubiquitin-related modifier 1 [Gonapodya prolifera JEL478]